MLKTHGMFRRRWFVLQDNMLCWYKSSLEVCEWWSFLLPSHKPVSLFICNSSCFRSVLFFPRFTFALTLEHYVSNFLQADANILPQGMIDLSSAYEVESWYTVVFLSIFILSSRMLPYYLWFQGCKMYRVIDITARLSYFVNVCLCCRELKKYALILLSFFSFPGPREHWSWCPWELSGHRHKCKGASYCLLYHLQYLLQRETLFGSFSADLLI